MVQIVKKKINKAGNCLKHPEIYAEICINSGAGCGGTVAVPTHSNIFQFPEANPVNTLALVYKTLHVLILKK